MNDYEPQGPDQLALWKNGVITVLDQSIGDGLWKGDLNGKVGLFPADVSVIFSPFITKTIILTHHHVIFFHIQHVKIIDSTEAMEEAETSTSNRSK